MIDFFDADFSGKHINIDINGPVCLYFVNINKTCDKYSPTKWIQSSPYRFGAKFISVFPWSDDSS